MYQAIVFSFLLFSAIAELVGTVLFFIGIFKIKKGCKPYFISAISLFIIGAILQGIGMLICI